MKAFIAHVQSWVSRLAIGPSVLIVPLVIFFAVRDPLFISSGSINSLLQTFALIGLVAVGLAATMIVGEFDLSVAGLVPLGGLLALKYGANPAVGIVLALVAGLIVGLVNGIICAQLAISSLMVTVGSLFLVTGLGFVVANGDILTYPDFNVGLRLDASVLGIFSLRSLVTVGVVIVLSVVLRYTRLGLDMYATGGDRHASRVVGVGVNRAVVAAFIISGLCATLAGSLLAFSLGSAGPTLDQTILLQAAAAALSGGIALSGGKGTPLHAAAGALFITTLNSGLSFLNYSAAGIQLANGLALVLVLVLSRRAGKRQASSQLQPATA